MTIPFCPLILETGEGSHSCFDPRLLIRASSVVDEVRAVRGQINPHDKVCGMSRRRQCTSS